MEVITSRLELPIARSRDLETGKEPRREPGSFVIQILPMLVMEGDHLFPLGNAIFLPPILWLGSPNSVENQQKP